MNYKNIVFDFGNVIARFDENYIVNQFCPEISDRAAFKEAVFHNWPALDEGTVDYQEYADHAAQSVPPHLRTCVENFFRDWHRHLTPIEDIWKLIYQLKERQVPIYLLSNAPTYFAEHADYYEIVKEFDGIVFSAPLVMAKPDPRFYQYLFEQYSLNPKDCLFIDDKPENIAAAASLGMDGIVFTGDISPVIKQIG